MLVGTATIGTPTSPPTTEGRAPSMPATTTSASALGELVAHREQAVQAGDADVVDAARPRRRARPRSARPRRPPGRRRCRPPTTSTSPRAAGSGPRIAARATSSTTAVGSSVGDQVEGLGVEPGRQHGAVGVLARAGCGAGRRPARAACPGPGPPRGRRCGRPGRRRRGRSRGRGCAGRSGPRRRTYSPEPDSAFMQVSRMMVCTDPERGVWTDENRCDGETTEDMGVCSVEIDLAHEVRRVSASLLAFDRGRRR